MVSDRLEADHDNLRDAEAMPGHADERYLPRGQRS